MLPGVFVIQNKNSDKMVFLNSFLYEEEYDTIK